MRWDPFDKADEASRLKTHWAAPTLFPVQQKTDDPPPASEAITRRTYHLGALCTTLRQRRYQLISMEGRSATDQRPVEVYIAVVIEYERR